VILLALDTCDSRGSLALLRDEQLLQVIAHDTPEDYSSWVLPNAQRVLASNQLKMRDVEAFAVAAGPGSFTGVRVGLTSVKAWSEVYGAKIASISRLEAIAQQACGGQRFVAAFVDAQREQVFGGLFRRTAESLEKVDEELVIAPQGFLSWVEERTAAEPVAWISMDPEKLTGVPSWQLRAQRGEVTQKSSHVLAPILGKIGLHRSHEGRLVDALMLDAQYVRRSDAEIFWKGNAAR
jgi:tRNA threonylcarbamoyl adenosine modification protein YeaZ